MALADANTRTKTVRVAPGASVNVALPPPGIACAATSSVPGSNEPLNGAASTKPAEAQPWADREFVIAFQVMVSGVLPRLVTTWVYVTVPPGKVCCVPGGAIVTLWT